MCGRNDGGLFYEWRAAEIGKQKCAMAYGTSCGDELLYPFTLSGTSFVEVSDGQRVVNTATLQNVAADNVYEGAGYIRNAFDDGYLIDLQEDNYIEKDINLHLVIDQGFSNRFTADMFVQSRKKSSAFYVLALSFRIQRMF